MLAQALEVAAGSGIDVKEAIGYIQDALALRQELSGGDPRELRSLASTYSQQAFSFSDRGLYQDAVQAAQQGIAALEALARADPNDPFILGDILVARGGLAHHLAATGRAEEAIRVARDSVQEAGRAHPMIRQFALLAAYGVLTRVLRDADWAAEAIQPATQQVEMYRTLESKSRGQYIDSLANALNDLSVTAGAAGRHDEAVKAAREVVALYRRMAEAGPARYRLSLAGMLGNLINALRASGRGAEAVDTAREAVAILEELAAEGKGDQQHLEYARQNLQYCLEHISDRGGR